MNADPTAWKTSGAGAGDAAGIDGSPYPAQVRYKHTRVTCSASAASCKPFLRFAAGEANGKKFRLDLTPGEATRLARVFHAGGDAGGGAKKGLNGKSGGGHHQTNGRAATPTHDVVDGWETVSSKKTTKKGGGGGSGGGSSPTTRRNNNNNGAAADGKDKIARGGKAAAGESYHHHHIHASSSALGDAADRASPPPPPPPPGPPRAPSGWAAILTGQTNSAELPTAAAKEAAAAAAAREAAVAAEHAARAAAAAEEAARAAAAAVKAAEDSKEERIQANARRAAETAAAAAANAASSAPGAEAKPPPTAKPPSPPSSASGPAGRSFSGWASVVSGRATDASTEGWKTLVGGKIEREDELPTATATLSAGGAAEIGREGAKHSGAAADATTTVNAAVNATTTTTQPPRSPIGVIPDASGDVEPKELRKAWSGWAVKQPPPKIDLKAEMEAAAAEAARNPPAAPAREKKHAHAGAEGGGKAAGATGGKSDGGGGRIDAHAHAREGGKKGKHRDHNASAADDGGSNETAAHVDGRDAKTGGPGGGKQQKAPGGGKHYAVVDGANTSANDGAPPPPSAPRPPSAPPPPPSSLPHAALAAHHHAHAHAVSLGALAPARPFAPPPPPPRLMSSPPEKSATGADGAPGLTADARNLLARRLGREMLELAHVQPFSPAGAVLRAERRAVDLLVRQVAAVVQTLNPGVAVEVFGSFPTASWVPGASNLDLAIALPEAVASNPRAKMDALNSLAVALRSNGWVIDVNVLPTARPLIIMNTHTAFFQPPPNMGPPTPPPGVVVGGGGGVLPPGAMYGVGAAAVGAAGGAPKGGPPLPPGPPPPGAAAAGPGVAPGGAAAAGPGPGGPAPPPPLGIPPLGLNNGGVGLQLEVHISVKDRAHKGAATVKFLQHAELEYPALTPVLAVEKAFLSNRGLRGVYKGGIGSYSLALLTLFSLQRRAAVKDAEGGGDGGGDGGPDATAEERDALVLGESLIHFLEFYGHVVDLTQASIKTHALRASVATAHGGGKKKNNAREAAEAAANAEWGVMPPPERGGPGGPGDPGGPPGLAIGAGGGMLQVCDPQHPGHNAGGGCFGVMGVQQSFREQLALLANAPAESSLLLALLNSPGRICVV